jgi:hypothetical protein
MCIDWGLDSKTKTLFQGGFGMSLFASTSTSRLLGPTKYPVKLILGAVCSGIRRPKRKADQSLGYSIDVGNVSRKLCTQPCAIITC